ncbi:CDP-glycerol glycerophosphotransferase family protein [Wielerella bovis]|uniref:CDP-glycerol glycerophosphotransferase family protein n=1 Tax=Wielerella bovis TaxID=2917790 RepID=UPI00201850CC|nr:CDP-glycerol glycerophosphotransferase family protein [Wielerella bovis]ULJ60959.1 CDP-glycerol glycerophosphotransferase family protein [Wielerella bovis]
MKHNIKINQIKDLLIGLYLYKQKKYKKAQKIFKKILDKQPNNAYLNFKYGMTLYKDKKWFEANKFIARAVNLDPEQQSWKVQLATTIRNQNNITEQKHISFKKEVETKPDDLNAIWNYSVSLMESKQFWLAKVQLEKYISKKANNSKAYEKLGIILEKLANYEEAFFHFQKAAELAPKNRNYQYRMGFCLEKLEQIEKSKQYYKKVFDMSPPEDEVHMFGIGALHAKRGLWDAALEAYLVYQKENNLENSNLYYRIAIAYERMYIWDEAGKYFELAIQHLDILNANWCFKCGQSYERAENWSKSVEFYEEAIKRSNDYKDYWYYRLAIVLNKTGALDKAKYYFTQSRKRHFAHVVSPKDVIKNKEQEFLSYYTEYYEYLPINNKLVLVESFFGNNISCNPYAILLSMLELYKDYTYIVIVTNDTVIPQSLKFKRNIIFIKRGSDAYLRYLCTAKYLINNVTFPYYFIRKEGQIYLNTWHGTPMKTLGKDIKSPFMDHANVSRNFLQATHIISPNRYTTNILLDKYDIKNIFNGKIAETGYPRIDIGINLSEGRKEQIKKILSISDEKPIIFYAPTWRGTSQSKDFDVQKLKKDLEILQSNDYHLIFRGHHLVEKILKDIDLPVLIAPKELDSNEILGICDLLITDYSSIIYDFLPFNKPAISYIYDYDSYHKERGLYLSSDELSGTVCKTINQVKSCIIECINKKESNILKEHIQKYSYLEDGNSTKRVLDFMLDRDDSFNYIYEKKETDIFFEGPFIPNGISRSFLNLMTSIKNRNIVLHIIGSDISKDNKRLSEFSRLPNNITVLSRVGVMPMTLEEIWVKNKFEETYQLYSDSFKNTLLKIYKREAKRLFGDSVFKNAINFEGYSLFGVLLFSQINAQKHLIYQHNDKYQEWKTRFPYLEGVFRLYQLFDRIVSVSEKTMENNIKNLSDNFNIPKEKFTFCNNPINIEQILSDADSIIDMEKEFSEFDGKKIINIGRMSHEKDQLKLIKAFAQVKQRYTNVRLFILGDGSLKFDLQQCIKNLNLEKDVYLLGQKTNPFPYLKQADLFVLSSNHEGQPMVLLEALTLGTPIVATDIVGNRSILEDKYGVLVDNSENGLIKGICNSLENGINGDSFNYIAYQQDVMKKFYSLLESI